MPGDFVCFPSAWTTGSSPVVTRWGRACAANTLFYFVIAGLDPAIHADERYEDLLGLHPGEPTARDALRRRHQRSRSSYLRAPRGINRRLHQGAWRQDAGLL